MNSLERGERPSRDSPEGNPFQTGGRSQWGRSQLNVQTTFGTDSLKTSKRFAWQAQEANEDGTIFRVERGIRPLLLFTLSKFLLATVIYFFFISYPIFLKASIAYTASIFGVTVLTSTILLVIGTKTYPFNMISSHLALSATVIFTAHARYVASGAAADQVNPLGLALVVCLASSLTAVIITFIPTPSQTNQLRYLFVPNTLVILMAVFAAVVSGQGYGLEAFLVVPTAFGIMLVASVFTMFSVNGYILAC